MPPVPSGPDIESKLEDPMLKLADEPISADAPALLEELVDALPPLPFAMGAAPVPVEETGPTPRAALDDIPLVSEWLVPGVAGVEEPEADEPLLPEWFALEEEDPGWVCADPVPKGLELELLWLPAPDPLELADEWPLPLAALPGRLPPPCAELAGPDAELTDPVGVGARELVGPAWGVVLGGCAAEPGVLEGAGWSWPAPVSPGSGWDVGGAWPRDPRGARMPGMGALAGPEDAVRSPRRLAGPPAEPDAPAPTAPPPPPPRPPTAAPPPLPTGPGRRSTLPGSLLAPRWAGWAVPGFPPAVRFPMPAGPTAPAPALPAPPARFQVMEGWTAPLAAVLGKCPVAGVL